MISIGKLGGRILSQSDKLDLKYMYGLLGKIKANLIARGLSMEWLFKRERWIKKEVGGGGMMEEEVKRRMEKYRGGRIEEKGGRKEVGGGRSKEEGGLRKHEGGQRKEVEGRREEEGGGEEEGVLGKEEFGRRVAEMIGGEKEGRRMANFLAEGGEEIRLRIFLFYLRKVGVKEVFLGEEEEEGRRLVEEVKRMREEVERRWGSTSKLEVLEVRQILEKSGFDNEIIDRILVKWVDLEEGGVDKKEFFKKMEDMMKMYKDEGRREEEERGEGDRGRNEGGGGINLRDLLTQEVGKTDRFLIRKFKYTERLVNLIRGKGREEIGRVLGVCRRVAESERGGRMNLNSFLNVLKYNVSDIPNSLLQVISK